MAIQSDQKDMTCLQRALCEEFGTSVTLAPEYVNSGFATNTSGKWPMNGLRHEPTEDTTGWYIWCGEDFSYAPDFFQPTHTRHLYEQYPRLKSLLGLPAGYRFLIGPNSVDIWFDEKLLNLES